MLFVQLGRISRYSTKATARKEAFRLGDCFFDMDTGSLKKQKNEKNEFELLSIPAGIDVDMRRVEANMRALQRRLHPDKFAQKSKEERRKAELASARVNTAFATIRDPLTRANRAIALKLGRDVLAEDAATKVDFDLLTEILEKRESVEDCQDEIELRQICDQNDTLIRSTHRNIHDLYVAGDFEAAARLLIRLQYYLKIRTEIRHKSEQYDWALHCAVPII